MTDSNALQAYLDGTAAVFGQTSQNGPQDISDDSSRSGIVEQDDMIYSASSAGESQ